MASAIDTLRFARRLAKDEVLPPDKAEALAAAINEELVEGLATKSDLAEMEARLLIRILGGVAAIAALAVAAARLIWN